MIGAFKDNKDIYATIAALSFNSTYEECLEFNPITGANQPEGKERRSNAKKVVLGITYGMSIPSLGEQVFGARTDMTEEEKTKAAQKIYDAVLAAFPNLRAFMLHAQSQATKYGYVETILGRRRHIPDMQLPRYQFQATKKYVNPDIDPLDPETLKNKNEIPERVVKQLEKEFAGYKYMGQVYKRIKELDEKEHIKVIVNNKKINDASRKCVNCVDVDTEILTCNGWKRYNEISVGDKILSYSVEKNRITQDTIRAIHISDQPTEVYDMHTSTFSSIATADHRWVTKHRHAHNTCTYEFNTTKELIAHDSTYFPILRIADNDIKSTCTYSDSILKIIGWFLTDGFRFKGQYGIRISQSTGKPKNLMVYNEMIEALNTAGLPYTDCTRSNNYHEIYLKKCELSCEIYDMFPDRQLTYEFVNSLSMQQAKVLVHAMVEGDGCLHKDGTDLSYGCNSEFKADIFQYLCIIAGYATAKFRVDYKLANANRNYYIYDSVNNGHTIYGTQDFYNIRIYRVTHAHVCSKDANLTTVDKVWCVTTDNSTWIARRAGKVYITGNSIVQGSAAELTKIAILKVFNDPEWNALGGRVLLPVHDELIAEIPIDNYDKGEQILSRLMSEAGSFFPFTISCDVTTTHRWYGLSYPCQYEEPSDTDALDDTLSPSKVSWIQYHLFEMEYSLPIIPNADGSKLEGDAAVGVNGIWSEALNTYICDYINKYQLESKDFIHHIKNKVIYDLQI